jgi:hypothetical protein
MNILRAGFVHRVLKRDRHPGGAELFQTPLRQHVLASRAPRADRNDLLGQVLHPRASCCGLRGIALVEPLQIIVELGVLLD